MNVQAKFPPSYLSDLPHLFRTMIFLISALISASIAVAAVHKRCGEELHELGQYTFETQLKDF